MIRIIGDVHGKIQSYLNLLKGCDYSIQLGDFGFTREWEQLQEISGDNHKIIPGNHDNYDILFNYPHCAGNFGSSIFDLPFFFVRGARSVDANIRIEGIDYWRNEELNYGELSDAISLYEKTKPAIVLSHDVTSYASIEMFSSPTRYKSGTVQALDDMFEIYKPKLWIFGHWHRTSYRKIGDTMFVCLGELSYLDLVKNKDSLYLKNILCT